jgi:hypothetical protein
LFCAYSETRNPTLLIPEQPSAEKLILCWLGSSTLPPARFRALYFHLSASKPEAGIAQAAPK